MKIKNNKPAKTDDCKYWNNYYYFSKSNSKPSNFANFVCKIVNKNDIVLELATGNGRDAFFLRNFCKKIYAIDKSISAIKINKKKVKHLKVQNLFFEKMSVNQINKLGNLKKINLIYARFFLHSINENKENFLLKNFFKKFKSKTLMALEFRTNKDILMKKGKMLSFNERYTDHYRRFIDEDVFEKKVLKYNGKIIYKKSGLNFSKTKIENPHLCRMIIQSK